MLILAPEVVAQYKKRIWVVHIEDEKTKFTLSEWMNKHLKSSLPEPITINYDLKRVLVFPVPFEAIIHLVRKRYSLKLNFISYYKVSKNWPYRIYLEGKSSSEKVTGTRKFSPKYKLAEIEKGKKRKKSDIKQ